MPKKVPRRKGLVPLRCLMFREKVELWWNGSLSTQLPAYQQPQRQLGKLQQGGVATEITSLAPPPTATKLVASMETGDAIFMECNINQHAVNALAC